MQKLVIDEFDEMLNLGFRTQLTAILAVPKTSKHSFSATMTDEVDAILNDFFDYPEEVTISIWNTVRKHYTNHLQRSNFNTKVNFYTYYLPHRYESRSCFL
jgi:ATP-dependent RNA helicase RhlE